MTERADGAPEIRLTDLAKHFRDVKAVDDVSLDIKAGEFFSLLGPSGCGKTTTLRMIGGFELPTTGRIELRGQVEVLDGDDAADEPFLDPAELEECHGRRGLLASAGHGDP